MLVEYYSPGPSAVTRDQAYWYAGGVVLCSALNVFMVHPYMMAILHMGMKFRVACCSLIYRKSLRLSKTALGETTVGQVVNLLSNDVNRFDVAIIFLHYLWIGPLATVVITYLMWLEISWAAVVGVGFMLMFIPLQAYLGKKTSVLRLKTALRTDERVRLMNEILSGIQVIKMYTWEKPFADLVAKARKQEIKKIRSTSYIRGVLTSFIMFTTRICLFCSILAFVLDRGFINAKQVFVVTSFYNILRQTMTVFFPQGIAQIAEAIISIKRLQKFMLYEDTNKPVPGLAEIQTSPKKEKRKKKSEDKQPIFSSKGDNELPRDDSKLTTGTDLETPKSEMEPKVGYSGNAKSLLTHSSIEEEQNEELSQETDGRAVRLQNASAKWVESHLESTLTDISLTIKPGKLIAVIGPVGAGKSSLLHVLLRELPLRSGHLHVGGSISYAAQEPWLFAGSVRQNILFGQPMDRPRYNAVVRRCALDRDFSLFPHGDKTVVGERGVSLSGGQRARISLARAVYKSADIYLLDDPLSAVDAHVGRHLFESCIVGYLRNSTRVLVTHQLQFLKEVDQIVILKNGTIAAMGDFDTLSASGLDFAELLARGQEEEETADPLSDVSEDISRHSSFRKRQMSVHSVSSVDNITANLPPEGPQEESEMRSSGAVSGAVYGAYFRASGHPLVVALMAFIACLAQLLGSASDWWTSYWVNLEEDYPINKFSLMNQRNSTLINGTVETGIDPTLKIDNIIYENGLSRYVCIYIYTAMVIGLVVISLLRSFMFFSMSMTASTRLHNTMFACITRAPMRFFHTNPSGRILNRFSKDIGAVDEVLPSALLDIGLSLIGIVVVVAIVNYWLLLPTLAVGVVFYLLRIVYISTSRSIKRLEGVTRSPVFSHLNASLQGITTIRAFGAQEALIREFDNHQDLHSSAWYLFIASSRAFGFWLDLVCVGYIAIVTLSFLVMKSDEQGGNVGLAITQAIGLTGMFQWGMRQSTELENQMTSVERIVEYSQIESEPPLQSDEGRRPPPTWPERGRLEFKNVSLYYVPDGEPVLRGLNFIIEPREKVGIVGRTGAGKSSLINALFRLAYIDGSIVIDDRDAASLGLHELRSRISIIPQEPVLFSGTMRHNLDPFDEYPDSVLWRALEEVELKEAVQELPAGLNSRMSEGGGNFSVGQRQLVCLARAILRRNRLLVLDEATANVDPQTDALIQTTIRNKFAECTVLTIAHRLHTVMDSDKVMVMDAGQLVEFDHPHRLLAQGGILSSMVEQTGRTMADTLAKIAQQAYEKKQADPLAE
ncbi:Probable multidrug resistance-associated protein lethal(2)03659 [Eumeta japonica]|uniref:Probable multidrug resistance-associated protein lethal(2)03659 n=1 Tax=Eumeta variegata TaxID=151549 RepID=A0A4C1UAS2_EUMVA|nr:Probable multidrug resistance-associated protein lethal(2)03659 [Eumeta japonica]